MAVISVGRHNSYGHPTAEVLAAYEKDGVQLYRTDRQGAVWITAQVSSPALQVQTARESLPQPIRFDHSARGALALERRNLEGLWEQWTGS